MAVTNETRREVMLNAWAKFRYERGSGRAFTFSAALVHAWAWVKGAAARAAAAEVWASLPAKRLVHFSPSLIRSPIARATSTQPRAGYRDHQAAYMTARLGR